MRTIRTGRGQASSRPAQTLVLPGTPGPALLPCQNVPVALTQHIVAERSERTTDTFPAMRCACYLSTWSLELLAAARLCFGLALAFIASRSMAKRGWYVWLWRWAFLVGSMVVALLAMVALVFGVPSSHPYVIVGDSLAFESEVVRVSRTGYADRLAGRYVRDEQIYAVEDHFFYVSRDLGTFYERIAQLPKMQAVDSTGRCNTLYSFTDLEGVVHGKDRTSWPFCETEGGVVATLGKR